MADDKAPKPSSNPLTGYDPIGIVIVVLLIITILGNIGNKEKGFKPLFNSSAPVQNVNPVSKPQKNVLPSPAPAVCGLKVDAPAPGAFVTDSVLVTGTTGACDWYAVGAVAVYVQITDAAFAPVSEYVTVPVSHAGGWNAGGNPGAVSFSSTILLTKMPTTKKGFVIFVHPDTTGPSKTIRIPIQFKK